MASISTTTVCKVVKFTDALPRTFFKVVFVRPIKRSQNPPNHGAFFGMKRHSTLFLLSVSFKIGDLNNSFSSSAAARYVEALSESKSLGRDFRLENLRNARRNVGTVRSVTISRCTALVVAHVKRHSYVYFVFCSSFSHVQRSDIIHSSDCEGSCLLKSCSRKW